MAGRHAPTGSKLVVKRGLRRLGLEASRPGGRLVQSRIRRIGLPPGFDVDDVRRGRPLAIDIGRVTTSHGFSYADGGWHPYWATLLALTEDPGLDAMASPLARFFARFQPASVQEALLPEESQGLWPLDALHPRYASVVWTLTPRSLRRALAASAHPERFGPQLGFGPAPERFVRAEFDRLRDIHDSMQRKGYRPDRHTDGYVKGYFLIAGDDYRFVPTEGQHRLAALRVLDVPHIHAFPRLGLSAVRAADLHRWTTRRGGIYTPEVAQRLFTRMFAARGLEQRRLYALE